MFHKALTLVFGSKHERDVRKILPLVQQIGALEARYKELAPEDFQKKTRELKERVANGETLDDVLVEAFALVREASVRTLGLRHFDVQLIGGVVLHQGKIAEMKTGEGKTLTATTAIYLNSLSGKGVHVVTVNDYLARRDAAWMKPIYDLLGVSVGVIQHNLSTEERKEAYNADITYATNNELGFDYLRDNMVADREMRVQREYNFGIVDEVDSILIDEARTPLIISGPTDENTQRYAQLDKAIVRLIQEEEKAPPPPPREVEPGKEEPHVTFGFYYDVDAKSRNVILTEAGVHKMEEIVGVENLYAPENVDLVAHTTQALRAHLIYKDEVDYVVRDGEVMIVDEHTGRLMEGRRYSDGLHQAIEAKEGVEIRQETQTLASITFQNFFRIYKKLAGMTGTADTEADEFKKIYKLEVVVIPTNVAVKRIDHPDRIYRSEREKFDAIVKEIQDLNAKGQPILVGTISIEKSEMLSALLKKHGIAHSVLNAKQHEREAEIVANAGVRGSVTVATNMAGRGTDIVLGGAARYMKDLENIEETDDASRNFRAAILKKEFENARELVAAVEPASKRDLAKQITDRAEIWLASHNEVKSLGGLHILGTERHEARRIDNQLRGRSGRQGDPGSSRFYLSLEDQLMRLFGGQRLMNIMERLGMTEGQELEAGMVDRAIARAQKRVENHNFDMRKHLLEYDDVMNRQREFVYAERNKLMQNNDVRGHLREWMEEVIEGQITEFCDGNDASSWDMDSLNEWAHNVLGIKEKLTADEFYRSRNAQLALFEKLSTAAFTVYEQKAAEVGPENFNYIERRIALDVIDARWKDHLYAMDHLREGIWAISYSERNPLVEYKLQGFKLFDAMVQLIKEQITEFLFRVEVEGPVQQAPVRRPVIASESHQSLGSFEATGQQGIPGLPEQQGKKGSADITVSGGGASKRKSSRKRRR